MKNLQSLVLLGLSALLLGIPLTTLAMADSATVNISLSSTLSSNATPSPTRPNLLGQNILAVQGGFWGYTCTQPTTGYPTIYPSVLSSLATEQPTILRYPGGLLSDFFHWSQTLGPVTSRKQQATSPSTPTGGLPMYSFPDLGLDEFLQMVTQKSGTQALMEVNMSPKGDPNILSGTPQEAAAWVAYCNAPVNGTNANTSIGTDENGTNWQTIGYWANLRSTQGNHPNPYGIMYWELGNEINLSSGNSNWSSSYELTAQAYTTRALQFISAMKNVDSTIKIGVCGVADTNNAYNASTNSEAFFTFINGASTAVDVIGDLDQQSKQLWMQTVLKGLNGQYDFFVWHHYSVFTLETFIPTAPMPPNNQLDTFCQAVLGYSYGYYNPDLQQIQTWLNTYNNNTPQIWLTEYSREPEADNNLSQYGRNLIIALGNADFMMQNIMSPQVAGAEFYAFNEDDCFPGNGVISANTFSQNQTQVLNFTPAVGTVVQFPVHWVNVMFNGTLLRDPSSYILNPTTTCGTYSVAGTAIDNVPLVRAVAVRNSNSSKVDILLLNKNLHNSTNVTVNLTGFTSAVRNLSCSATEFNSWNTASPYPLFDQDDIVKNVYNQTVASPKIMGSASIGYTLSATLDPHSLTWYSVTTSGN